MSFYDEDEEVVELKRHFIDANVENGCKIASITDEYIDIKTKRKELTEKLLSLVPEKNKKAVTELLSEIASTFNQQSSKEFDCVLGNLFDKINMASQVISDDKLKRLSSKNQN